MKVISMSGHTAEVDDASIRAVVLLMALSNASTVDRFTSNAPCLLGFLSATQVSNWQPQLLHILQQLPPFWLQ